MNQVNITYTDTSKECIDLMKKYAKEGLKAGGKIVTQIVNDDIKANHYRTGGLYKSVVAWAKINYKTRQPYMEIGYRSKKQKKKRGIKFYVNPWWFEMGILPHTITTRQYKQTGKSSYELHDHKGIKYGSLG